MTALSSLRRFLRTPARAHARARTAPATLSRPSTPSTPSTLARLALVAAVTTGALAGIACKGSRDGQASPSSSGGRLEILDGGLSLLTDAGVVSMGAGATLPADFPRAVPVYPAAKINMASRSSPRGKPAWSLSLETSDERAKVVQFYASNMGAGFTKASDLAMGDTQMTIWQSAQDDVTLMVATAADDRTTITMTVTSK